MSTHDRTQAPHRLGGDLCSWRYVGLIDNALRLLLHNPVRMFGPYVQPGDTALDIGCGGGFASRGLARLVGDTGTVISADLQPEMLQAAMHRAQAEGLAARIRPHQCERDRIGVTTPVDFAVAFWMLHETPDQAAFLAEVYSLMKPGGRLFIAEPKMHVTGPAFEATVKRAAQAGFTVADRPRVALSRAVALAKPE